jgi:hypothetical protein
VLGEEEDSASALWKLTGSGERREGPVTQEGPVDLEELLARRDL